MCLFVRSRTVMRYVPAATRAALRPAAVFRLIAAPGPTVPVRRFAGSAGGGGGGGGCTVPTVNEPRMMFVRIAHVPIGPSVNVTVRVTVLDVSTVVAWFTPGPVRWKLCSIERSLTVMV